MMLAMKRRLFTVLSAVLLLLGGACFVAVWRLYKYQTAETNSEIVAHTQSEISTGLQAGGMNIGTQQVVVTSVSPAATKGDYRVSGKFNTAAYGTVRFQMRWTNFGWDDWRSYGNPTFDKPIVYVKPRGP